MRVAAAIFAAFILSSCTVEVKTEPSEPTDTCDAQCANENYLKQLCEENGGTEMDGSECDGKW